MKEKLADIKREFVFKAVLMGEGSVGKTSIRSKFMGVGFKSEYIKTIGADFASKAIVIGENKVHFQIWDLAGQKMYKHVRSSFYSGCKCGFLVFDLTEPETLDKLETWVEEAIQHSGGFLKIFIIIGNKNDLVDDIKIKDKDVEVLLKKLKKMKGIDAAFIKTSALTGENIHEAFEMMGKMFLEKEGFPREGAEEIEGTAFNSDAPKTEPKEKRKVSEKTKATISIINEKINRLSDIMSGLEERILLIESQKPTKENQKKIESLRNKITDIQDEIDKLPENLEEEKQEKKEESQTDDFDLLSAIPSVDEIKKQSTLSNERVLKEELEKANKKAVNSNDNLELISSISNNEPINNQEQTKNRCPNCGGKLSFIKQYDRWYCYQCKNYV